MKVRYLDCEFLLPQQELQKSLVLDYHMRPSKIRIKENLMFRL